MAPRYPVELAPLANRYLGWVWAALPAESRRVRVIGDPELAALLRAAGLDAGRGGGPGAHTTVVALGRPPTGAELAEVVEEPGAVATAMAWPGKRRAAANVLRGLREAGLDGRALVVTARLRRPILERAGTAIRRRARPADETVVLAGRAPPRSLLDEVLARAARAVGHDLVHRSLTALSTGTVLAELAAPSGERFALRLAGGPAAGVLERSADNVAALLDADPPLAVRQRVLAPRARGVAGPVRWTLEDWIPAARPRRMSTPLWDECLEFLVALHRAGTAVRAPWSLARDFQVLTQYVDERGRHTLARLEPELECRLADVPRGWAHGDFWPANLLVDGNRLLAVLDWDSASVGAPAMLDLMHLRLLSDRRARRLPHGSRSLDVLLPVAQRGGDSCMRRYCEATATPAAAWTLEGLALAYWVSRVGRDLRSYANRPSRRAWMDANLHQPLGKLTRAGW
jgi:aminoglycoside phosphotransferase (APT) family kinase protein